MQDHSRIAKIIGLPIIDVITVDGREIPIMSSRPLNREFLIRYVYDCIRKPKISLEEFIQMNNQGEHSQTDEQEADNARS